MLDRIKVRGVRWVRFETDTIALEERKHELRCVNFGIVLLEKRITEGGSHVLKDRKEPAT
jgi:hypothetical protein